MSATTNSPANDSAAERWAEIFFQLNHVWVLGVCGVLLGAFVVQFAYSEMPCPLCLLQRMGMMLALMGPAYMLLQNRAGGQRGLPVLTMGFGMSILGAVVGMFVSARQVLLHIAPGDPGYGSAVMGMHLYTWALVVFVTIIVVSGLNLVFATKALPRERTTLALHTKVTLWIFGLIVAANVVLVFMEAGFNLYLPDNPEYYMLFR